MNYRQIVEDTRSLTRMFKALESFQQALETLGDLDQAVRDAEARKAIAVDERERAVQAMQAAEKQMAGVQSELDRARLTAKEIVDTATAEGAQLVKAAGTKAQELLAGAEIDLDALRVRARIVQEERDGAQQELEAKQRELLEVEGKITRLKQQASRLLEST